MGDIKSKAITSVKWNTVSIVFVMIVQILRLSVLTRLLEKTDFGLIAIATMVIGFTDIFSELGLTVAVIHKQDISDKQYSSVFWTNIILSVLVFAILCLVSPLVSSFYNEPQLTAIIPLLGIQILLNSFGKMFQTIKSKNLEFEFLSKIRIYACIFGFSVTVVLAFMKWGVYSLVFGQLAQVALMQACYTIEGRKEQKILWHLNFKEISDFIKIGSFRLGSQVLDFISSKMDVFLIRKFFGMDDLGIYNLAKDLITRPYGIVNMLTSSVASAAFAKIQNSMQMVRDYYMRILNIISTLTIPIYTMLFIAADLIVKILYGSNYPEVAVLLRILCFYGIECSISSQGAILQVAMGRTDIGFKWTLIRILFTLGIIIIVSNMSIYEVAYGQLLLSVLSLYLFWKIAVDPIININIINYLKVFARPLFVSLVLVIPFFAFPFYSNYVFQIIYLVLFGGLFMLYYWIFQKQQLLNIYHIIKNNK